MTIPADPFGTENAALDSAVHMGDAFNMTKKSAKKKAVHKDTQQIARSILDAVAPGAEGKKPAKPKAATKRAPRKRST